eukprot:TRINITY_DN12058_c0_g1_i5.p1 TRINITY_DN12058_c0_g1~~TRINITY_DN12058_c0_g1_i5.p1  ORF type:complete len:858 (+),score=270.98 TRINITY_DN12058_c0_g1_i5:167-2740(+)
MVPKLLKLTRETRLFLRESFIGVFVYLPQVLDSEFEVYLKDVLDHIIDSLADENENIRNLGQRVVKILIQRFGGAKTKLLLEPVYEGMSHPSWRKRNSSIVLMAEMLEILRRVERTSGGTSGNSETIDRILASVYILMQDTTETIRSFAAQTWKTFVENTPKKLRAILGLLFRRLVELMALPDDELQEISKASLMHFVGKYGDALFGEIMEALLIVKRDATTPERLNPNILRGVNMVLKEVAFTLSPKALSAHKDTILRTISDLLTVPDKFLRRSAFDVFVSVIRRTGNKDILDSIVPGLFASLDVLDEAAPEYEAKIRLFDELLEYDSSDVFDYLEPLLFARPIKRYCLDIMTNNAEIFGAELYKTAYLKDFIRSGLAVLAGGTSEEEEVSESYKDALLYCMQQLECHMAPEMTQRFIDDCLVHLQNVNLETNKDGPLAALELLQFFFHNADFEYSQNFNPMIEILNGLLFERHPTVNLLANRILKNVLQSLKREESHLIISFLNNSLEDQHRKRGAGDIVPGFNTEEGLDAFVDVVMSSLVYGTAKVCESALSVVNFFLLHTTPENLQPTAVLKLVGALIRISTYRMDSALKLRVLDIFIKALDRNLPLDVFHPQLETIILRLLIEHPSDDAFVKRVVVLAKKKMADHPRREFLINEAWKRFGATQKNELKVAYLRLMYKLVKLNPKRLAKVFCDVVIDQIYAALTGETHPPRTSLVLAQLLGLLAKNIPHERVVSMLKASAERLEKVKPKELETHPIEINHLLLVLSLFVFGEFRDLQDQLPILQSLAPRFVPVLENLEVLTTVLKLLGTFQRGDAQKAEFLTSLLQKERFDEPLRTRGDPIIQELVNQYLRPA